VSNKSLRKSIEIVDTNVENNYFVATISTSQPDRQKDVITSQALSKVLINQEGDCIHWNIEHKQNKCFASSYLTKSITQNRYYEEDGLAKLDIRANFLDNALGEQGKELVKSSKSYASLEGRGKNGKPQGQYIYFNDIELTGCAITSSPANPGARIKEFNKSYVDIFSTITNRKDWKSVVSDYVVDYPDYIPELENSFFETLWDVIQDANYNVDNIDRVIGLMSSVSQYSFEDDLITPMIESVKNILASKTSGLQKSQIEIASQTISKGHNNLASFLNQGLQKSYNNNNL
jgi:hypothetical protein